MLKNYQYYQNQRQKIFIGFMIAILLMAVTGVSITALAWQKSPLLLSLLILIVTLLAITLALFIKKNKDLYKTIFIILLTFYLYAIFWIFPESAVMLSMLAIAPIIPIFLFDKKGFIIVASFNITFGSTFIYTIACTKLKEIYTYLDMDTFLNIYNFIAIQVILLFAFFTTNNKLKTIEAYHKELEQAKQENSISQLAASIAHEIRTPITVVKGFAQLLEEDQNLNDEKKAYVKLMLNELNYTELIITDYLSLAKPQSAKIHKIELNTEIQKVADLLLNYAQQQQIDISLSLKDDMYIRIDPIELKQVLVNIIKNGIESMKANNSIEIYTCQIGNMAKIGISDNGLGMTQDQIEQLGTPFYSLKDRGTGIGLTICYHIVHKYKGDIEVTSRLGVGTTFNIYLPLDD